MSLAENVGARHAGGSANRVHFQLFTLASGRGVRWRLLSANRREIARSVDSYADVDACEDGIAWLRDNHQALRPRIQRGETGAWSWELLADARSVVAGGRNFDRQIRCVQALSLFHALVPAAGIHPMVMGPHARRGHGARVQLNGQSGGRNVGTR